MRASEIEYITRNANYSLAITKEEIAKATNKLQERISELEEKLVKLRKKVKSNSLKSKE